MLATRMPAWLLLLLVWLGALPSWASLVAQATVAEVAVTDAAALAAMLPKVTAWTLVARSTETGTRLPNLPEHAALLADRQAQVQLAKWLAGANATGLAFGLGEADAELLLHLDGRRMVRGRIHFAADAARFGMADFALTEPLPQAIAQSLRQQWQRLARAEVTPRRKVQVSTTRELIAAIGSDRAIELMGGPFVLASRDAEGDFPANPAVTFHDLAGEPYLEIHGVRNLHLRSLGDRCQILGRSPAEVIWLRDCSGISCEGLVIGHVEGVSNICQGPVLHVERVQRMLLRDCDLFGCGAMGIAAENLQGIELDRCEVHTCSVAIADFRDCTDVQMRATTFRDCALLIPGFQFVDCARVAFYDCHVKAMAANGNGDSSLFEVRMDEAVQFLGGSIRGNRCRRIVNSKLLLVRDGVDEGDNGLDRNGHRILDVQPSPAVPGKG